MASQGHIKIDRRILNWEWYSDSNMVHVFLHLLLNANYSESRFQGVLVKRGELIIGRLKLAAALGLSEMQIRTCLNKLKSTNEISIKTTNRFSIVTICKYDSYQSNSNKDNQQNNQQDNQQITNNQPTDNQQITTSKKNKEDNKNKEYIDIPSKDDFLCYIKSVYDKLGKSFSEYSISAELKYDSWVINGWKDGNDKKIKNWKSKINNTIPYLVANTKQPIQKANQPYF